MPRKIGASTFSENFQGSNYTDEEWAFIKAVAAYQKRWNRRYPTWREVLFVLKCLGYRKVALPEPVDYSPPTPAEAELTAAVAGKSEARNATSETKHAG